MKRGVAIEIKELPDSDSNLIIAVENELLPLSFQAEIGAYINGDDETIDLDIKGQVILSDQRLTLGAVPSSVGLGYVSKIWYKLRLSAAM